MELIQHQLIALFPALAFLIFGVLFAVLLDRLNFFRACADIILHRNPWRTGKLTLEGIVTENGTTISFRQYISFSLPIAIPTLLAASLTLLLEFWLFK